MKQITKLECAVIALFMVVGLGVRLAHMTGPIGWMDWRQAETAYMAKALASEWPPEMMEPKVPYRGHYHVKAAEYPIYPLVVGVAYKGLGGENLVVARLITLLFFLGATVYLFKAVEVFFNRRIAWYVVPVYWALPLGVFYSRAIHPDFSIIFFSHAFLYYGLRYYRDRRWLFYGLAVVAASCAFLMKAPYCFYFGLPLAAYALWEIKNWTWQTIVSLGAILVVPLLLALWFNEHRIALEAPHVESLTYPMKWTREFTREWFFGTLAHRLDPARWGIVVRRVVYQVLTPFGLYAALVGFFVPYRREHLRGWWCLYALGLGVVVFALTVWPHFSSSHEYYSLPLLAPAAVLIGLFLAFLFDAGTTGVKSALRVGLSLCLLWAGSAYGLKRANHFQHDWQRLRTGAAIQEATTPDDLVLSVTVGRSTGWSDPRILYYADRLGWAIEMEDLTPEALELYRSAGATCAAVLVTPQHDHAAPIFGPLEDFPRTVQAIHDPEGQFIGHVVFFDLQGDRG